MLIPRGIPFSYFKDTEPFSSWFRDGYLLPPNDPWVDNIFLYEFKSEQYIDRTHSDRKTYLYTVEFKATQEIRILLNNPPGVLLSFGSDDSSLPNNIIIKIIPIADKYGKLGNFRTEISGDIKFIFPTGFLYPARRESGKWIPDNNKKQVELPLGSSVIKYEEKGDISFSEPLVFERNLIAFIAGKNITVELDMLDIIYSIENKPQLNFINSKLAL